MIAKKIKDLLGARIALGGVRVTKIATYEQTLVNLDYELAPAASTGAHTSEFEIYDDGETYKATYYNSLNANNYAVSYYDSAGTPLGGIMGGSGTSGIKTNIPITPPTGTRMVRVFSTQSAEANLVAANPPGIYKCKEMKMRPEGASAGQVVWPTETTYRIISAHPVFSRWNKFYASGSNYATAAGDIEVKRGEDVQILSDQPLTPLRISLNDTIVINGVMTPVYSIDANGRVRATDLGTTEVPYGTGARVVFGYQGEEVEIYVEQEANVVDETSYVNKSYTGYRFELSETDFVPSGGSATVTGYKIFSATLRYLWTSGSYSYGGTATSEEAQSPASISVTQSPSSAPAATVSGNTITFPANTGSDENTYAVRCTWSSFSDTQYAYVYGADTGRNYSSLSVSMQYPNPYGLGRGYIPASGGSMYPEVSVSIYCNGTRLSGSVSDGSTAVEVSGGSYQTTIMLSYDGAPGGFVSAGSRGATIDTSATLLASVRVTATKTTSSGTLTDSSNYQYVYQQKNEGWVTQAGSFSVRAMTVEPQLGGVAITGEIPAKSATVGIVVRVTGNGTTTRYSYTSGATSGGDSISLNNEEVSATLSVTSGGSPVTVTNQTFTASNQHNLTAKAYNISATYEGTTRTATVNQKADAKLDGDATYYATLSEVPDSDTLWAGGGSVYVEASAYHISGKVWESDGAGVSGESSTTYDLSDMRLILGVEAGGIFAAELDSTTATSKTYRIDHRDMKNNAMTDTLSVVVANSDRVNSTPLSYSVTNQLGATEYPEPGDITWGTPYAEYRNYAITLALSDYDTAQTPASFLGASLTFDVTAGHEEGTFRDGVQSIPVYRRYASWSSSKDDIEHKAYVRTDSQNYNHQTVTDWHTVNGDTYSVVSSQNWATISGNQITIAPQGDNDQRSATITATNTADPGTVKANAQEIVYQAGYAEISANPTSLVFDHVGGNDTFALSFKRIYWAITSTGQGNDNPITLITPTSGGGARGEQTITVYVAANNTDVPLFAEILISPNPANPDVEPVPVDVLVKTATVSYDYIGTAICTWVSATRFQYSIFIQNRKANPVTFSGLSFRVRSTTTPAGDPASGQSEKVVSLGTITAPGGDVITQVASGAIVLSRESGRYYYAAVEQSDIHSEYIPFEESAN
ncbi:MAG: hypothetical protein IJP77_06205 [Bacteroidales bacterium]|nr:hypothetical protein [Bacteroidales bacterium]